jgi:hypothetical protein
MTRKHFSVAIAAAAIVMIASLAVPATAATTDRSSADSHTLTRLQQNFFAWLLGSDSNPIVNGICGEQVADVFYLNVALNAGNTEYSCSIPVGTRIVASPGGAFANQPVDGMTDAELLDALPPYEAPLSDPAVSVDGRSLHIDAYNRAGAYSIPLGANSLLAGAVPGTSIRIATSGWFERVPTLSPGAHTIIISDEISGDVFQATFHITVTTP